MSRIFVDEKKCKHSEGFFCTTVTIGDDILQHCFACVLVCGFWLPFSPEFAGNIVETKPQKNPIVDMWRLNTVAFLPHPAEDRKWKDAPQRPVEPPV